MKLTKLTALILTGTMALSLLPLTAMADTTIFYGDGNSVTQEEASQTYESTEAKPVAAVEADGAKSVTVDGDVIGTEDHYGIHAKEGAIVEVDGSVTGTDGVVAKGNEESNPQVTIEGDVIATKGVAVEANMGASVEVYGNVISKGEDNNFGVSATGSGTKVTVLGVVEAGNKNGKLNMGVVAANGAEVRVYDNVKVTEGEGISVGVQAEVGTVLIDGDVNYIGSVSGGYSVFCDSGDERDTLIEITGNVYGDIMTQGSESDTIIIGGELDDRIASVKAGDTATQIVLFKAADAKNMFVTGEDFLTEAEYIANTHYIIGESENNEADYTLDDKTIVRFYGVPDEEGGEGDPYDTVIEGAEFTVSVTVPKGFKLKSFSAGDGIDFIDNGDGTYTITAVRGGGIELEALLKKIAANVKKSSGSSAPGIYVSDTEAEVTEKGAKLTAQIACSNMAYVEAQLNSVSFRLDGEACESEYFTVTLSDTGKLEITLASELIALLEPGMHIVEMRFANGKTITFEIAIA